MEQIKFSDLPLHDLGHSIEIAGMVLQGQGKTYSIMFPKSELQQPRVVGVTEEEWKKLLFQLDTLEAIMFPGKKHTAKVVARKSTRHIEQGLSWNVFRRDNYTCRYCGKNDLPLSIDHIVLWEDMGATVEENLNCACRKCNKERGNMQYDEWLKCEFYTKVSVGITEETKALNINCWEIAQKVPIRVSDRNR